MSKQFGGGELLRAMLESEAVDSMPFFYMAAMTGRDGTANPLSVQTATVQTENDSVFLQTSVWGLASNAYVDQPEFIGIFDGAQNDAFMFGPSLYYTSGPSVTWNNQNCAFVGLLNDSLASCVTLPEYILWGPNSLIACSWLGRNTATNNAYRYLVLGGIKYHLKGK